MPNHAERLTHFFSTALNQGLLQVNCWCEFITDLMQFSAKIFSFTVQCVVKINADYFYVCPPDIFDTKTVGIFDCPEPRLSAVCEIKMSKDPVL